MLEGSWIPLSDYSGKYKVSVSTLRRRIKAEDIEFRFEDGKYFLLDEPMGTQQKEHRPSPTSESSLKGAYSGGTSQMSTPTPSSVSSQSHAQNLDEESVLAVANQLLTELKKAYMMILQEKEEQILQLREEVTDLKTLARILEAENERLKGLS